MTDNSKGPAAEVIVVPVLSDNYAYIIIDKETNKGICVDPVEPQKVINAAKKKNVEITLGICTHKHADHSGGNEEILRLIPNMDIIGSAYESIVGVTKPLKHNDNIDFGSLSITAYHTPCHTAGHELFYITNKKNSDSAPLLFTGDTLFIGGCGRFFEGNAQQMLSAMNLIKSLPDHTLIYCGHEYTVNNLKFALTVDNMNEKLKDAYKISCNQREKNEPTVPSTVAQEKEINPFMRVSDKELRKGIKGGDQMTDEQVMATLRDMKNRF